MFAAATDAKLPERCRQDYFSAKLTFGFKFKILLHSYFLSFYFLQVGQISRKGRDAVFESFAECLPEKNAELLRGKYCGENFAEFFMLENCFSTDNYLKYRQLNPAFNSHFALLLGLRLLSSFHGK